MSKLFGTVYQVVENPFEKDAGIQLLEDPYKGLVYQYGNVQFVDGEPQINFERTIRKLPDGIEPTEERIEEFINNSELNDLMGEILVELMDEQMKKEADQDKPDGRNT